MEQKKRVKIIPRQMPKNIGRAVNPKPKSWLEREMDAFKYSDSGRRARRAANAVAKGVYVGVPPTLLRAMKRELDRFRQPKVKK